MSEENDDEGKDPLGRDDRCLARPHCDRRRRLTHDYPAPDAAPGVDEHAPRRSSRSRLLRPGGTRRLSGLRRRRIRPRNWRVGSGAAPPTDGPPVRGNNFITIVWIVTIDVPLRRSCSCGAWLLLRRTTPRVPEPGSQGRRHRSAMALDLPLPGHGGHDATMLYLPEGKTVTFDVTSLDVVHGFWIVQMGDQGRRQPGCGHDDLGHARQARDLRRSLHGILWAVPRLHDHTGSRRHPEPVPDLAPKPAAV